MDDVNIWKKFVCEGNVCKNKERGVLRKKYIGKREKFNACRKVYKNVEKIKKIQEIGYSLSKHYGYYKGFRKPLV